ncbi:MAG TPA: tyrosine-type recombinase/integrase [Rhizomicrobium sp.]|nr:tyrosine-type recombinase/integrase [Rhizomicrobium sp.]
MNRYLQVIRGVFKRAHKMRDPITRERVLVDLPDITDLDELKRKPRPIPEPVLTRLFEILPQHVIEATAVSLLFGFRKGEVFGLKRDKVDFDAKGVWLDAAEVKDDEDDFLPGSELAMEYLGRLASQAEERGVDHLITWKRPRTNKLLERWEPIKRPKTAWKTAMRKIEAEFGRRYRFHDVRAAFLTHIAETVGPLAAQKMGRHSEYRTTERYVSLGDAQKRKAASAASDRNSLKLIIGGKA